MESKPATYTYEDKPEYISMYFYTTGKEKNIQVDHTKPWGTRAIVNIDYDENGVMLGVEVLVPK